MRTTVTLLLAIVLLASCNQYKKTPSGLPYKIIKGDGKVPLKNGMFVKLNIEYKVPPKDSILMSTYDKIPAYLVIDTARPNKYSFLEVITQCAVGDKIEFTMSVDSLKKLGMIEYSNVFRARDMIKGRVEILKAYNSQEEAAADLTKEQNVEKERELKQIADYVTKKGIKTQATRSGSLVEIQVPGDQSLKADSGKMASIRYRGTLMKEGTEFDSNMNPNSPNKQLLNILVGSTGTQNSVIPGMDEAIRMFGKGGKGRMFIPAAQAYGQNGTGPIPAYANLVFEIEVVDVTTPPPPAPTPAPQMPQAQPKK